jgi:ketosteroid isomerase-like protein
MPSKSRVQSLVAFVEQGRILEAIEEFYADDVVMQESNGAATVGKAANLERERAFLGSIADARTRALAVTVDEDQAAINWLFEFTGADGKRYRMDQVALQRWRGDRIAHERFFYDSASLLAEPEAAAA